MLATEGDDVVRQLLGQARYVGQEPAAGGVQLDTDAVDATGDDVVEAVLQRRLVDVVLILADADRLRIDLHQLGEGVGKASADGHRAAHGQVVFGELVARHRGGRVHRGARFVDHDHLHIG